eukprot:TRINITY_DN35610_c0_g1_i1.p1 TRINITY_DN35610_c0_g1~~TRINITY_DN35610_c0_g1_i1.p1  ORF type:complete len:781 (-),score=129.44 TRINITY_DN35610_c0_g1_i1:130-2169(-)
MSEWAHNARGFLNDASKFNAMHFLESSGWSLKLAELAKSLSHTFVGDGGYRPSRDAGLPIALSQQGIAVRRSPEHTAVPSIRHLKAVGISYHTALLREPLAVWQRVLNHRFEVATSIHVLDASATTPEDVQRLHAHCRFIDGAWCRSDDRLLQLNELFENEVLADCHKGDHKARHHFLRSTEEYYNRFVQLMGDDAEMRSADLFMCGEPVLFCRLLSYFGKPVVGYISTPLSVYVSNEDRPAWYQQFYEMALDPLNVFAATTPIFAEWVAYATGISLPVVRPVTAYTEAHYWPIREREVLLLRTVSLFWDSECVLNYFAKEAARSYLDEEQDQPFVFRESTSLTAGDRVGYGAFAEFLAAVIYPYAFSQFWFYELYSMAVPIYMPAKETLALLVSQDYAVCPGFEGHRPGHAPHRVHPYSPFDMDDWEAMTYWTKFTDYVQLPHVQYFDSVPNLILKLQTRNHRELSRVMKRKHTELLGHAASFWGDALEHVAGLRGIPRKAKEEEEEEQRKASGQAGDVDVTEIADELRDLSTRQLCGGSPARHDAPPRLANDGSTRQDHPNQYHFDMVDAKEDIGGSHWWVKLRRHTVDPQVKLWPRDCCHEAFGHKLWLLLGDSADIATAKDCAVLEVRDPTQLSTICYGSGKYFFVEARPEGGDNYQDKGTAILMLPEVRVLARD